MRCITFSAVISQADLCGVEVMNKELQTSDAKFDSGLLRNEKAVCIPTLSVLARETGFMLRRILRLCRRPLCIIQSGGCSFRAFGPPFAALVRQFMATPRYWFCRKESCVRESVGGGGRQELYRCFRNRNINIVCSSLSQHNSWNP
jgi:hypothetical protein